jgi:hypothetical protein
MNITQLQNMAINVVEGFCSVISMPVELILRPWYGTRYFPVPVFFFSAVLMILLPAFSAVATGVTQMIPFAHFRPPAGLFGIGALARLFFLLSFLHGIRLYRRMIRMELEDHSQFEGPPLPFIHLIPGSGSFWLTRIAIEPAFLFIAATLLGNFYIVTPGLAAYLHFAALTLAMKNFVSWYRAWEFLRDALDMRNAGPLVARLLDNTATEADLARIHLASFPKNLAPDIRQAAAAHIARVYSPGIVNPEPTASQGETNATD